MAGRYVAGVQNHGPHLLDTKFVSKTRVNAYTPGNIQFSFNHKISHSVRFPFYLRALLWIVGRKPRLKHKLLKFGVVISLDVTDDLMWVQHLEEVKILVGFFQNYKFISSLDMEKRFLKAVDPKESARPRRVGLHVRLGDYALAKNPQGLLPSSYYLEALQQAEVPEYSEVTIFSDEPNFALENFESENLPYKFVTFPPGRDGNLIEEVDAMRDCDVLICANSSFSLMAGIMKPDRTKTFVPDPFYRYQPFDLESFPEEWVRIKVIWG
jgi:hypothetical protein